MDTERILAIAERETKELRARIATLEAELAAARKDAERWKLRAEYAGSRAGNSDAVYFALNSSDSAFDAALGKGEAG